MKEKHDQTKKKVDDKNLEKKSTSDILFIPINKNERNYTLTKNSSDISISTFSDSSSSDNDEEHDDTNELMIMCALVTGGQKRVNPNQMFSNNKGADNKNLSNDKNAEKDDGKKVSVANRR